MIRGYLYGNRILYWLFLIIGMIAIALIVAITAEKNHTPTEPADKKDDDDDLLFFMMDDDAF